MSTHLPPTAAEPTTTATAPAFTTRNAPRTFCPHNTNPCPEMFSDKWTTAEQ
jgi:hypothetical protein